VKYTMARHGNALSDTTPRHCLNQSGYVMATLLRPGDRFIAPGGSDTLAITERLLDEDGELVLVLEDGSHLEVVPLTGVG
jgi:hypothetical protein